MEWKEKTYRSLGGVTKSDGLSW